MTELFSVTALAAGMLLLLNPCSFAMLPTYVGLFLNNQSDKDLNVFYTILRAQRTAFAISAGLLTVFLPAGLVFTSINSQLGEFSYWLSIVLGFALVGLGVAMLLGFDLILKIPKFTGGSDSQLGSFIGMYLYGISYATAAMGCSLPIVITGLQTNSDSGFSASLGAVVSFCVGMVVAITTLTLAIATGASFIVRAFRAVMTKMKLITALILIPAGFYLAWYGWWSQDPVNRPKGPIELQESINSSIQSWLETDMFGDLNRASFFGIVFLGLNIIVGTVGFMNRPKDLNIAPSEN